MCALNGTLLGRQNQLVVPWQVNSEHMGGVGVDVGHAVFVSWLIGGMAVGGLAAQPGWRKQSWVCSSWCYGELTGQANLASCMPFRNSKVVYGSCNSNLPMTVSGSRRWLESEQQGWVFRWWRGMLRNSRLNNPCNIQGHFILVLRCSSLKRVSQSLSVVSTSIGCNGLVEWAGVKE